MINACRLLGAQHRATRSQQAFVAPQHRAQQTQHPSIEGVVVAQARRKDVLEQRGIINFYFNDGGKK
jgi:hypothetical protein